MAQSDDLIFFTGLLKRSLLVMGMWPLKTDDPKLKILYKVYGKIIQTIFAVILIGLYSFVPRVMSREPELLFDQAVLIIVYTIVAVKIYIITKGRLYEMIQNLAGGETGNYPAEIRLIFKKYIKSCETIYRILFYWAMIGATSLSVVAIQENFLQDSPGGVKQLDCTVKIDFRGKNDLVEGDAMKMASKNYSRLIESDFLIPIDDEGIDYFTRNISDDLVGGDNTEMMSRYNKFTGRNDEIRNNQDGNDLFDLINNSYRKIEGKSTRKASNNQPKFSRRNRFNINAQIESELFHYNISKHLVEGEVMKMTSINKSKSTRKGYLDTNKTAGIDIFSQSNPNDSMKSKAKKMTSIPYHNLIIPNNNSTSRYNNNYPATKYIDLEVIKTTKKVSRDDGSMFTKNSHYTAPEKDTNDPSDSVGRSSEDLVETTPEHNATSNNASKNACKSARRRLIYNTWSPYDTNDYYAATMAADVVLLYYCCLVCCMTDGVVITLIISFLCRLKVLRVYLERYHLEEWCLGHVFGDLGQSAGDDAVYRNLRACVVQHQVLIRYMEDLDRSVNFMMFLDFLTHSMQLATILMLLTMLPVSLKLFWALNYFLYVLMQLYFFYWWSNEIQLESVAISNSIYDGDWYNQNPRIRIVLLIIMTRAQRSLKLHIGPLYDVSNEVLVKILRTFYSLMSVLQNFNGN